MAGSHNENSWFVTAIAGGVINPGHGVVLSAPKVVQCTGAQTAIGESPASVSSAAAALAEQVFGTLDGRSILLLGAGGLFGIDRLASNASNLRTSAAGVGVNPATLLAAKVNFGQFFNAQSALGNIANLQQSLSGQVAFNSEHFCSFMLNNIIPGLLVVEYQPELPLFISGQPEQGIAFPGILAQ